MVRNPGTFLYPDSRKTLQRRLPSELVDHIVDHLHDERPTLHQCSLVNHEWLISSWFHLFGTLHIKVKEDEEVDVVLNAFNQPPSFHAYVRTLHLQGSELKPYRVSTSKIHESRIIHIYSIFPSLQTYILNGFLLTRLNQDSSAPKQAPGPTQRILPKLVLADVDMEKSHLIIILSSLRPIREIQFSCVEVWGLNDDPDTIPTLGLKSATFEGCYSVASLTAASFFNRFPHLKCDLTTLDIDILSVARGSLSTEEQIRITGSLINEIGPQLTGLRLDFLSDSDFYSSLSMCPLLPLVTTRNLMRPDPDSDSLWKSFNLVRCTSLQSLWVSVDDRFYGHVFKDDPLLSLIAVLTASAHTLQHLTLALGSADKEGPFPDCIQDGISQFERFLVSLPVLRSLMFVVDRRRKDYRPMVKVAEPIHSDKRDWLMDKLPALQSKRILRIPDI